MVSGIVSFPSQPHIRTALLKPRICQMQWGSGSSPNPTAHASPLQRPVLHRLLRGRHVLEEPRAGALGHVAELGLRVQIGVELRVADQPGGDAGGACGVVGHARVRGRAVAVQFTCGVRRGGGMPKTVNKQKRAHPYYEPQPCLACCAASRRNVRVTTGSGSG
eukprot:scaffold8168_cov93-Isochrysis_galbana.AAC.2